MERQRGLDLGAVFFGLILLGVGGYFLFRDTLGFQLPDLEWDAIWPLFIIAIGVGIVWRAWDRDRAKG